jgi:hypothetical protein
MGTSDLGCWGAAVSTRVRLFRASSLAVLAAAVATAGVLVGPAQGADTGEIKGSVTGAGDGVVVSAYRNDGGWGLVGSATTKDGRFSVTGLVAGVDYRIGFFDPQGRYAIEYYRDKWSVTSGVDVRVGADLTVSLDPARHIRGKVTDTAGNGLEGIDVSAFLNGDDSGVLINYATTDAGGSFDIGRLPWGNYRLQFSDLGGTYTSADSLGPFDLTDQRFSAEAPVVELAKAPPALEPTPEPTPQPTPSPSATATATPTVTPSTPAAPAALTNVTAPKVKGKARVGKKLRALAGSWTPSSVTYRYQWLANGKPIKGATTSRLTVGRKQLNRKLSVRVTATAPDGRATTVTSPVTAKVKAAPARRR